MLNVALLLRKLSRKRSWCLITSMMCLSLLKKVMQMQRPWWKAGLMRIGLLAAPQFQKAWSSRYLKLLARRIQTTSLPHQMRGAVQTFHCMQRSCWRIHVLVSSRMSLVFVAPWNKSLSCRKKAIKLLMLVTLLALVHPVNPLPTLFSGGLVKISHSCQTSVLVAFVLAAILLQFSSTPWKILVRYQSN